MTSTPPPRTAHLDVRAGRSGNSLVFDYRISAPADADIYIMDNWLRFDAFSGASSVQPAVSVSFQEGSACVLVGIPPRPVLPVAMPHLVPLANRVSAGTTRDAQVRLLLPFAEESPYFPDVPIDGFEQQPLVRVVFLVQAIAADEPGFVTGPCAFAPDHVQIVSLQPDACPVTLATAFPTQSLSILTRLASFLRPVFPPPRMVMFDA